MSYAPKRRSITKKQRAIIFEREHGICYLCGLKIEAGQQWQADHELARELGGSDELSNLRPAHVDCHKIKSKADVKAIAKSNRLRKKSGLDPVTKKPSQKIKARPLKSKSTFQKRRDPWGKNSRVNR